MRLSLYCLAVFSCAARRSCTYVILNVNPWCNLLYKDVVYNLTKKLNFEICNVRYCKSANFGVLLYLANLANCVSSLIFVAANIYVDRTLHGRAAGRRQI